jgi:hypothetical protein
MFALQRHHMGDTYSTQMALVRAAMGNYGSGVAGVRRAQSDLCRVL